MLRDIEVEDECKNCRVVQSSAQKADEEISLLYSDLKVVLDTFTTGSLLPLSPTSSAPVNLAE